MKIEIIIILVVITIALWQIDKHIKSYEEDRLINMIMKCEEQYYSSQSEIDKKIWKQRYLNILDYICYKYLTKKISERFVIDVIKDLIVIEQLHNKSPNKPSNLVKTYKKLFQYENEVL